MRKSLLAGLGAVMVVVMLAFAYAEADAARIGGGRSFGGRPSMSQPFTRSLPSNPSSSFNRQAQRPGQQMANAASPAGRGLFGGMGGMLGGLLAGSLLGSLLFGGGFHGGVFLDIIIFGGLLSLAYRFFSRRRAATQGAGHGNAAPFDTTATPTPDNMQQRTATPQGMRGGFDWDALTTPTSNQQTYAQDAPNKPADFDEEEFLRGAKAAYARLNSAWDKRDLADIAQFSTPAFMKEIEQQAEEDKNPGKTEIMLVNASLVQVDTIGAEQIAQVYFNVLLREDPTQDAPTEVREIWHFTRPANGTGTWKLDGIQQVDNSAFN